MTSPLLPISEFIPSDVAENLLELTLGNSLINSADLIEKSFYDFDLTSEQGIVSFLAILPFLDPEIVKQAVQEVWPGYQADENFDVKRFRYELRGHLLDYLNRAGESDGTAESGIDATVEP